MTLSDSVRGPSQTSHTLIVGATTTLVAPDEDMPTNYMIMAQPIIEYRSQVELKSNLFVSPVWIVGVRLSHPDLRTNSNASHKSDRIKSHTYDESVYRNQCHIFIYMILVLYKITK